VHDGKVYTLGAEGNLICLNATDGAVLWSRSLKEDYKTETPIWGFSGHPLVDGRKLICIVGGEDSVAVAFDKDTGKELWRSLSAREPGYSAPTIIQAGGTRQLLIWHPQALASIDPNSGRQFWSEPLDPNFGMSIVTPRQLGDLLFVGAIINKALMLRLDGDQPRAAVLWQGSKGKGLGPVFSTPFLEDGHMYGVDRDGELRCVKLDTGAQLWSTYDATTADRRANSATAFLVKHGERFFLFNEQGDLIIARLSPQGYDEIGRTRLLEATGDAFGRKVVWSHPAFANRSIYARNDKELVCASLAADDP
jgi:outer membrane protein assembly factor BamB